MVGRDVSVLFEKPGRFDGQLVGKSQYLHAVHVAASTESIGQVRAVQITQSSSNSLSGELI